MDYANIILEMLDRIKTLETELKELKSNILSIGQEKVDSNTNVGDTPYHKHSEDVRTIYTRMHYMPTSNNKKDTTRYMFNGNVYLKNRLVLAVVQKYVSQNNAVTIRELIEAFPKSLQGSIGVIMNCEDAFNRFDYSKRFFARSDEIIHLVDGDVMVCTQWGIGNIDNFIRRAEQLGYTITAIK